MEVTMVVIEGDPAELHRAWRDELLPVARPRAQDYGWQRSIAARGERELVVINLWADAEGLDRALADPDIDRVQREAIAPLAAAPPRVWRLEVADDLELTAAPQPTAATGPGS